MSNEIEKEHHEKRILQKDRHVKRQVYIRKKNGMSTEEGHRYHKMSGVNCGNPRCVFCGNPRRIFKELTIQERRFMQTKLFDYEGNEGGRI